VTQPEAEVQESAPTARAHHLPAAGLAAAAVALLVVLPELFGDVGRLAAVLVLQLGLVLSWVLVTGVEGFAGSLAVGAAAAVAADLVLVLPERAALGDLLVVLGMGFLAAVLQQMFRRPRTDLVASLSGVVLLLCPVVALAALLLLGRASGAGRASVALLAVGVALVVGHLVDLVLPRPQVAPGVPRGVLGLLVAVPAAAAVTVLGEGVADLSSTTDALVFGVVLGSVAALTALVGSYLAAEATAEPGDAAESPWALSVIQAALPLAACGPVALALLFVL
jgi:hypothetical protein